MSRVKLVLVAAIAILFAQISMAQSEEPSLTEIDQLTKQIVRDNPRFFNHPDLVYSGDTVRIVEKNKTTIYTVGKWSRNSENGCLWQIAAMHLNNRLKPAQVSPAPAKNPSKQVVIAPINPPPATKEQQPELQFNWQKFLLTMLVILVFLIFLLFVYLIYALKKHWSNKAKDPNNFDPVIPGGLPEDPSVAFDLICQNYPRINEGKHPREVSCGNLLRNSGAKRIEVKMSFVGLLYVIHIIEPTDIPK